MNYDELKAGREADAMVAEKIMGWFPPSHKQTKAVRQNERLMHSTYDSWWCDSENKLQPYLPPSSTDKIIAIALLDSWEGEYQIARLHGQYICDLYRDSKEWHGYGPTFELAVCRTRLKAAS